MNNEISDLSSSLNSLTQDEIAAARKVLNRLEWDLFQAVLKKLKLFLYIVAGLLAVVGAASIATIRSAIIDAAANRLAADRNVRDQVIREAGMASPEPRTRKGDETTSPEAAARSYKYDFESDAMGWVPQSVADIRACTAAAVTDARSRTGRRSLELVMSLDGSDPTSSVGEAYVELRDRGGTGELQTLDLSGRTLVAWVYAPRGSRGASDAPNGLQLFVKDAQFRSAYGPWKNVAEGAWNALRLPISASLPGGHVTAGFDPAKAALIGVKFAAGGGSRATYKGSLFVDDVDW